MRYRHVNGLTSEMSGDRVVILDASGETLTTLNATGALLWSELEDSADVDELASALAAAHDDVGPADVRDDVVVFLDELAEAGLVEATDAAS